jgi:hypothetical protein
MAFATEVSRKKFDHLEKMLRQSENLLSVETVRRFQAKLPPHVQTDTFTIEAMAAAAAHYIHQLVVVATALYPSEITLRKEYEWAATGTLQRYGIGYREQVTLLQTYFASARDVLNLDSALYQAIDLLENAMLRILTDVFAVASPSKDTPTVQ